MNLMDIDRNAPLDWLADQGLLLQKACFIGDMGESHMMTMRMKQHMEFIGKIEPQLQELDPPSPTEDQHREPEKARAPDEPLSKDEQIKDVMLKTAICNTPTSKAQ